MIDVEEAIKALQPVVDAYAGGYYSECARALIKAAQESKYRELRMEESIHRLIKEQEQCPHCSKKWSETNV